MVDALKAEDAVEVERIVREIGALVCTPSTIPDIYSLSVYRSAIARRDPMKFWALLDNNIVTQIVSLISGTRQTGAPLSDDEEDLCDHGLSDSCQSQRKSRHCAVREA